jgi:hypothetical protein
LALRVGVRFDALVSACRSGKLPSLSDIDDLKKGCTSDAILEHLSFARLFFGAQNKAEQVARLGPFGRGGISVGSLVWLNSNTY